MMNVRNHKNLNGFSLVELLVVISIIAVLLAIMIPSLSKARLQARVLIVNYELNQVGLALEAYESSNAGNWPAVRWDCMAPEHIYSLPPELVDGGYLPGKKNELIHTSTVEDKFYTGHTYKYVAVGKAFTQLGTKSPDRYLSIPQNFPTSNQGKLVQYKDRQTCPVKWVLFSLGPGYPIKEIGTRNWKGFPIDDGFPVLQDSWYGHTKPGVGILTRIKTSKNQFLGTFQKSK